MTDTKLRPSAEERKRGAALTAVIPSINHHGTVPQAGEQEAGRVLQAQHRAALRVTQGQQALCRSVHAAVDEHAGRTGAAQANMMNERHLK